MIDKNLKIYDNLCTGCSACTEVCNFPDENNINPIQLIKNNKGMSVPRINHDICTECMACYKACPTEDKIYNDYISYDKYIGQMNYCYYGYSLDREHRFEAATAGITTEIASYLLDNNQVEGVVSSYQNDDNEIIVEIFISSEKIKKTRGSIYRQVSLLNDLAKKIEVGQYKKLLLIGLPCHILGVKTLQKTSKYLRKNVEFITVALFCKQTKTEEFSKFERLLLKSKENQKIDYRGKGWPGTTRVNKSQSIPSNDTRINLLWGSFAFTPDYCFSCNDPLGLVADISVGDAWLSKYNNDKIGSSLFLANTKKGFAILTNMKNDNSIYMEEETRDNIIVSQGVKHIKFKTLSKEEKDDFKYKIFLKWILGNKKIVEIIYKSKLILIFPNIILKVYSKLLSVSWRFF